MVDVTLFKRAIEQTKDYAMFLLDKDGYILTWNLGAERLKGYAPKDIIGRHFSTFYTSQAVESGWPDYELKAATREGRFEDEGWRVRKDGSRFWANVIITALRDDNGQLLGFSKITRDLTERKLHEEALGQSEERFRLLVEGVEDYAIYMLDPEGMISSWNAGAQRIKGYSRSEVIGKHFSRFFLPEDTEAGKPWEELAVARRSGRYETRGWRLRKDGGRFWARVVVTALHDAEGNLRGFAKLTQDLTDQRHIEDLEKAARNVNEFIAVLAHELRNPLAPIRTAVQVMANAPAGSPAHEAMRQTIDRQSSQLARIVDDMIDITRITRGELGLDMKTTDLNEVVRNATETAGPGIEQGKHRLEVELAPSPLYVHADPHRLTQVVSNLLNNAARYTPSGGHITISVRADQREAVLRVRDTGRGIEPEMIDRIFDMFVQARPVIERVGGGLGIGLALARRITELHNGSLSAYSEGANKGAEFVIRLPQSVEQHTPAAEAAPAVGAAAAPQLAKRVLVVDDNVDAATSLEALLRSLGHETRVVHDGLHAVAVAETFAPDVVLLDIGLPGVDGYEVARRMREGRKGATFRIVAVTGWGQEADRQRAREAGFDVHLVKPIDVSDLTAVLSQRNGATLH